MSFWDKIQEDIKKNIQESLEIFREGSSVVTEKLEKLTEEGKKKYRVFNLNMKVQEELTKLGGEVYDLVSSNTKNPLGNRKVKSIITAIKKLESQINGLEARQEKKPRKTTAKKSTKKAVRKTGKTAAANRRSKPKNSDGTATPTGKS